MVRNVLLELVELTAKQSLAMTAMGNHLRAVEEVLKFRDPELAKNLTAQIAVEQKKSEADVQLMMSRLQEMRIAASQEQD